MQVLRDELCWQPCRRERSHRQGRPHTLPHTGDHVRHPRAGRPAAIAHAVDTVQGRASGLTARTALTRESLLGENPEQVRP